MAYYAGFIGIDRHNDPSIRDLTGAKRDATALWALLSDSMPELQATRLVDGQATLASVRDLFERTLGTADHDDVVFLSFAGHGTPDHRLVLADTRYDAISETTIDMAELADRFRASRARAIFCILDCCFSGGAPARVLEDAVGVRHIGIPLAEVGGRGRILIAASNIDEPALEDPVSRHGLFTKALVECLLETPAPVSLVGVIDRVVRYVRASAARLGRIQTPVLFGHVEGELSLPAIRPGTLYAAAFPEQFSFKVGPQFQELAAFGIDKSVLDLWADRFPGGLNPLQLAAINDHGVLARRSLLTVAPTSAGKTFIGEVAAIKAIMQGEKAILLLPYKALVNEKYEEFAELYGERLGLRVVRCSGDWQDQTGAILRGKYDIAFFTYETFLTLALSYQHILTQLGLVVLDEAQFIADSKRGIVVELLLTTLVSARARGIEPQIIALSAVIGHTNAFEKWLGCGLLHATERPVPLVEGVMDRTGVIQVADASGAPSATELLPHAAIRVRRDEPSSQDMIVPLVRKLVADGEKVIVFRNTRGSTAGCATYLAAELGLPPAETAIEALPQLDRSRTSQQLGRCLAGGTAFHNSDLTREERAAVEAAFRDPRSAVRVLVATSTVAAGVNTPASTVIIVETDFFEADGPKPYTVAQYKNMVGRAGRLGFEQQGKAVLLADTPMERERLFRTYVRGTPEPVTSSFDSRFPETWLIRLLAQVERVTRAQAVELIANTYGGFLAAMAHPGWQASIGELVADLLQRMEADGLVEGDGSGYIRLSILGHACGQSPFTLESAMRLVGLLRRVDADALTPEGLMALIQALPEQDDDYTPLGKGRSEAGRPGEVAARFGRPIAHALRQGARTDMIYYARCKRALILSEWIRGAPIERIEEQFSPNAFIRVGHGDIRGFADTTRFYLGSASRIAAIVHAGAGPSEEEITQLLKQLDTGLPAHALALLDIPLSLVRGEYLALNSAGVGTFDDLRSLSKEKLTDVLGRNRAEQISELW